MFTITRLLKSRMLGSEAWRRNVRDGTCCRSAGIITAAASPFPITVSGNYFGVFGIWIGTHSFGDSRNNTLASWGHEIAREPESVRQ